MRKYLSAAALGLALAGSVGDAPLAQPVGPPNQIGCTTTNAVSGSPGTSPLVVGVAGKTANLCGWAVSATAAATLSLITGGGATCATNSIILTAAHAIPAGTNMVVLADSAKISAPQGNYICGIIGGTGPVQITVFFSQF